MRSDPPKGDIRVEDLVTLCSKCGSCEIRRRSDRGGGTRKGNPDDEWICWGCGETFDEPVERPRQHPGPRASTVLSNCLDRIRDGESDPDSGGDSDA